MYMYIYLSMHYILMYIHACTCMHTSAYLHGLVFL